MPTAPHRDRAAVVFVDYLTGFLPALRTIQRELYDGNVTGHILATQALGLPHCVLGDEGGFRGHFFPAVKEHLADAPHFARHTPSAWRSGGFQAWAVDQKAEGRSQIVLGGISIDNCVTLTALDLLDHGFDVFVVTDVSGAESELVERTAIARLVQAGAVPITWVQFACEVMGDWQSEAGPKVGGVVSEHSRYGTLGVPAPDAP